MRAEPRFRWAVVASCAAVAAFTTFLFAQSGTSLAQTTSDLVLEAAALLAAWACARAARRGGADSRGWRVLSLAAVVWAAGNAVWTTYGLTRDHLYPFPSVADIGFVGFFVVAAFGLLSFPRESERLVSRVRTALDVAVIATSVLFISWATVLGPLYRTESADLLSRTGMAYPIVDIAVASLVLALGMRRPVRARMPWVFLGGGLVTLAVTDSIYVHRTVEGVFASGTPLYAGWLIAFLLIALVTVFPARVSATGEHARLGRVQEFLPYVPFLGALLVIGGTTLNLSEDPFLLASGLICLVVFAVRQALIVIENLVLRDDLRARVEERTAELAESNRQLRDRSDAAVLLRTIAVATNEAPTADCALQVALDEVCRYTRWPVGHVYLVSEESADEVRPMPIWHVDDPERFEGFRRATDAMPFVLGVGLPGRVAGTALPVWIDDVTADAPLVRAAGGEDLGVRAGFGVPVLAGREVLGVLEFFSCEPAPPDPALLDVVAQVGTDLGRVIERKRAEEALRHSEGRTRSILEAANDAFLGMDESGLITDWNRNAETIFGWTAAEARGRSLADTIIPPAYRKAHSEGLARFLATGEGPVLGNRLELSALHRDGREFPAELSIWQTGGKRPTFIAFVQDITERKENERSLAQARDQAVEASRAKSEFLATMSHEIRTPMNGVIGLTGLLLDTELNETQRHHAERVRASGEALLAVINDILDFSKIEAGRLELEMVDFDLAHAIEEVAALVAESTRVKGLELVAYCRPEVPTALRGDVGRLRQILLNFATNAVKFTAAGEVVLRAGLAEEPTDDGVVVRCEVADTGVGISPGTTEKLFTPFSQADASTTRRYGGTGLGLAICRRLAEAMGGTVGVDSRPGEGSTFWLHLPLAHATQPIAAPDCAGHSLAGRRVLVVDDNATNRLVLASQLRAWDIAADVAPHAEVALERLRAAAAQSQPYDLALVDMAMPGMDGLELATVITSDPRLASVPLLLLSSVLVEAEATSAAGFVARLTKPVRLSNLYDALVRAVTLSTHIARLCRGAVPLPRPRSADWRRR
ncbi:MAG: ATP-binding protein [Acidimicrobiales bacterium]